MENKSACFFTGNREIEGDEKELIRRLNRFIEGVRLLDVQNFLCGGARGFDLLAAECVLERRKQDKKIKLVLVQPFRDQTKGWEQTDIERYEQIKKQADEIVCLSEEYYKGCMHMRNRYLVDNAFYGIAYNRQEEGGTVYTLSYAEGKGRKVFRL